MLGIEKHADLVQRSLKSLHRCIPAWMGDGSVQVRAGNILGGALPNRVHWAKCQFSLVLGAQGTLDMLFLCRPPACCHEPSAPYACGMQQAAHACA